MPAHTLQSLVAVAHEAGQLWEKLPTLEGAPAHDAFLDEPKGSPRYVLGARRQIPASIHCTGKVAQGGRASYVGVGGGGRYLPCGALI